MLYKPTLLMKAFASPMRYYQGPGLTQHITPKVIRGLGTKPLIVGGPRALNALIRHQLFPALKRNKIEYIIEEFGKDQDWGKECCDEEVDRLTRIAEKNSCDLILGVGGGKSMDTHKAVSHKLELPVILFPTVAATDAPTASLSVMYTADHKFKEYRFYSKSPDVILVDTKIIAEAPARFLAGGIGDAFSKKFEVDSCYHSGHNNQIAEPLSGFSPLISVNMANLLYNILKMWGRQAMLDARNNLVSAAIEAIVEGNILISGLAFESGGLSAAHSIYNGLTVVEEKMKPPQYHGELVHFGTCVQVILEGQPFNVIYDVFKFGHEIGLPESLEEVGLPNIPDEDVWRVAEKATAKGETIHKMSAEISSEQVFYAIKTVDKFCTKISNEIPRALYE